jgi:hypothetical protein
MPLSLIPFRSRGTGNCQNAKHSFGGDCRHDNDFCGSVCLDGKFSVRCREPREFVRLDLIFAGRQGNLEFTVVVRDNVEGYGRIFDCNFYLWYSCPGNIEDCSPKTLRTGRLLPQNEERAKGQTNQ